MNLNNSLSLNNSGNESSLASTRMRSESLAELKTQNRKRILNSAAVKLNLELERMHTIELIELEEKLSKKSKSKKSILKTASLFEEKTDALKEQDKLSKDIVKQPPENDNTTATNTTTMPKIKTLKTLRISENTIPSTNPNKIANDINKTNDYLKSSIEDQRFQSLLYSMASTYRPVSAKNSENPDETILKLYRSNSAFLRNGTMIALQDQDKQVIKQSYEENFRRFERAITFF